MPAMNQGNNYTNNRLRLAGGRSLQLGQKTLIMGILNVTPDSFADGGRYAAPAAAVAHALKMQEEGADIIDIGGQSTRPGSQVISAEEEWGRLAPVLTQLVQEVDLPISVDTYYRLVAERALEAGAHIINDVSGLNADPDIAKTIAQHQAAVVIQHARLESGYQDLLAEVSAELASSIELARTAGIGDEQIIIDPGVGFGKTAEENLRLIARLAHFKSLGYPLLLGVSRKGFLGTLFGQPLEERLEGSLAAAAAGIMAGADMVRVHDVASTVRLAQVLDGIKRCG